jgi:hypothetical protein
VKTCTACGVSKDFEFFYRKKDSKDGRATCCIDCRKVQKREEYLRDRDVRLAKAEAYRLSNQEKVKESKRVARLKKIDVYKAKGRDYYVNNKDRVAKVTAAYRLENREKIRQRDLAYKSQRRAELSKKQTDYVRRTPLARIAGLVRSRINEALARRGWSKRSKTPDILGCDYATLVSHIESQFKHGMSWANRSDWHIDHILPLASATDEQELIRLCHWSNLRPLWAHENLSKGKKVVL